MLTDALRRELQVKVQQFIGAGPSWDYIAFLVGADAVVGLPGGLGTASAARWIIASSLARPDPALLVHVVDNVVTGGDSPDLTTLAQSLRDDPSAWIAVEGADLWIPSSRPFLDRTDLRTLLGATARGQGDHPVITIEAPIGHGKRTIAAFIEVITRRAGTMQPVVRTLEPSPEPGLLDALVADLRTSLRLPMARPTTHEEPEREAAVLARDLVREAAFAQLSVWFVANILAAPGVEPGAVRFVDELIGLLQTTPQAAKHLRVAVLAVDTRAVGLTNLPPPESRFVLPEVTEDSILEWLTAAVPGAPEELYPIAVQTVVAGLEQRNAPQSRRLEWLALHCVEAHRLLLQAI